uniref:Uncharacterized protein n=1 Tax=Arundo donax TaxID=35708 RepID=A0A0A9G938_ARUDO
MANLAEGRCIQSLPPLLYELWGGAGSPGKRGGLADSFFLFTVLRPM